MLNKKTKMGVVALGVCLGAGTLSVALTPSPAGACSVMTVPVDMSLVEVRHISGPAAEDETLETLLDEVYNAWPAEAMVSEEGVLTLPDETDDSFRVEVL